MRKADFVLVDGPLSVQNKYSAHLVWAVTLKTDEGKVLRRVECASLDRAVSLGRQYGREQNIRVVVEIEGA